MARPKMGFQCQIFSLLLLVWPCLVTSESSPIAPPPEVTPHNWLQITTDQWPTAETTSKESFYLYHTERLQSSFRLQPDFFGNWDTGVATHPELSFNFWANHDFARLRHTRKDGTHIDLDLKPEKKWTTVSKIFTDLESWRNLSLVGSNAFLTMGLKDVQVKYIPKSPIHGYQKNAAFAITKDPISILTVATPTAKIEIIDPIAFPAAKQPLMTFSFVAQPGGKLTSITLKSNEKLDGCDVEPKDFADATFTCEVTEDDKKKKILKSLTVTLKARTGSFALFNPSGVSKMIQDSGANSDAKKDGNSYVNFIDSQPDFGDVCYTLDRGESTVPIEVYLTMEKLPVGLQLTTITTNSSKFCINDYLALRFLKNYQLTLLVKGKIPQNFLLTRAESEKKEFAINEPKAPVDLTKGWFYYSDLVDYTIQGPSGIHFQVCNIVVKCFPYEETVDSKDTTKSTYTISQQHRKLLEDTPFIRITSDRSPLPNGITFKYFESKAETMKAVQKNVQEASKLDASAKLTNPTPESVKIAATIKKATALTLKIPLKSLDERFQSLKISIKTGKPTDQVTLSSFIYDGVDPKADLKSIFELKKDPKDTVLSFSTQELFNELKYMPFKAIKDGLGEKGNLIIVLSTPANEASIEANLQVVDLVDTLKPKTLAIEHTVYPQVVDEKKITLDTKNKKILIASDPIRASFDQTVVAHKVSLKLTFGKDMKVDDELTITKILLSNGFVQKFPMKIPALETGKTDVTFTDTFDPAKNPKMKIQGGTYQLFYRLERKTDKNTVTVSVDDFKIDDPEKLNKRSGQKGPMIALLDPRYNPTWCDESIFHFDNTDKQCHLAKVYTERVVTCHAPDCSNIFAMPLISTNVYSTAPSKPETASRYYPYQIDEHLLKDSYLQVGLKTDPDTTKNSDYCIEFSYDSTNTPLTVTADLDAKFAIDFPASGGQTRKGHLCRSWFALNDGVIKTLYFRFPGAAISEIEKNYVHFEKETFEKLVYPLNSGTRQSVSASSSDAKWEEYFMEKPNEVSLGTDREIDFTIKDLQKIKTQGHLTSRLRTRWIRIIPTAKDLLRLRLTPSGDYQKEYFRLSLIVSSSTRGPILMENLKDHILGSSSSLLKLNLSTVEDNSYTLTFQFDLDLAKVTTETEFTVKLSNIAINDPCISDENVEEGCSGHGICKAVYEIFKPVCSCSAGYSDTRCSTVNYCTMINPKTSKSNQDLCQAAGGLKCISKIAEETFECQCKKADEKWNILTSSCIGPAPQCADHETLKVENGKSTCACVDGYIRLKQGEGCTEYDVCNEEHRMAKRVGPKKPCSGLKTQCQKKESDPTQFECICENGFYNENGRKDSSAKCLADICHSCEQMCNLKDSKTLEYVCACSPKYTIDTNDPTKCVLKDGQKDDHCKGGTKISPDYPDPFATGIASCSCPKNFLFNRTSKVCDLNQALARNFGCTKIELKPEDKQPGCVCADGQVFDSVTRKCANRCTDEKIQECASKKANCEIVGGKAQCLCPKGKVAFSDGSTNNFECIDNCQLLEKPELLQFRCTEQFQRCNPTGFDFGASLQNGIFILKNSTLSPASKHCSCEIGFEPSNDGGTCILSTAPVRLIKNMEFFLPTGISFKDDTEKTSYATSTIRPAFLFLLKSLFKSALEGQTTCQPAGDKFQCTGAVPTKLTLDQIIARLTSSCIISADNSTCTYMTEQLPVATTFEDIRFTATVFSGGLVNVLSRDATKAPQIEAIDYCSMPNICSTHPNSVCTPKPIGTEILFECLCDPALFAVQSTTPLSNPSAPTGTPPLQLQSCSLRDLCTEQPDTYGCKDKTATCSLSLAYDSNKKPQVKSFCTCPNGSTLPKTDRLCTETTPDHTCAGRCLHGDCVADAADPKKFVCRCKPGFEGERCEKMIENKDGARSGGGVSGGYRTATIVLSIFFAFAVIALVLVAVKKFTGFNVVMYVTRLIRRDGSRGPPEPGNVEMQRRN